MVLVGYIHRVKNFRRKLTGPYSLPIQFGLVNSFEEAGYVTFIKFEYLTSSATADRYVFVQIRVGSASPLAINIESEFPQPANTTYIYFIALGYESKKVGNNIYLPLPRVFAENTSVMYYDAVNKQSGDQIRSLEFMTTTVL